MTQLALLLFSVVLLVAVVAFVDGQVMRRLLARERSRVEALRIDVRRAEEETARLRDEKDVGGRTLAENVDELRRAGLFRRGDPHRKK